MCTTGVRINVSEIFNNSHFEYFLSKKEELVELLSVIIQFLLKHRYDVNKEDIITINEFLAEKDFSEFCPCFFCKNYSSNDIVLIPKKNKNKIIKFELSGSYKNKTIFIVVGTIEDDASTSIICKANIDELVIV